ncbi:MAG: glycosyltransferase family 4 protein [Candidatus Heimdallarchaeota archaeon]
MKNMSELRVCMVLRYFFPHFGGVQVQAHRLALALQAKGVRTFILTSKSKGTSSRETFQGIPVIRLPVSIFSGVSSILFTFGTIVYLLKERKSFDILHSHQAFSSGISVSLVKVLLKKGALLKITAAGKFSEIRTLNSTIYGKIMLWIMKQAFDVFLAVSEEAFQEIKSIGVSDNRIMRLGNGVDLKRFRTPTPEEREKARSSLLLDGFLVALYVGRISKEKGLKFLLCAWKNVCSRLSKPMLVIIGDGPQLGQLKALAESLGIHSNVRFEGRRSDVASYYQAADIFVLPSISEGLSNALLEALACELPAVATKVGGNLDLIRDGVNGILVPVGDRSILEKSLVEALHNLNLRERFRKELRISRKNLPSLKEVSKKYVLLYKRLYYDYKGR